MRTVANKYILLLFIPCMLINIQINAMERIQRFFSDIMKEINLTPQKAQEKENLQKFIQAAYDGQPNIMAKMYAASPLIRKRWERHDRAWLRNNLLYYLVDGAARLAYTHQEPSDHRRMISEYARLAQTLLDDGINMHQQGTHISPLVLAERLICRDPRSAQLFMPFIKQSIKEGIAPEAVLSQLRCPITLINYLQRKQKEFLHKNEQWLAAIKNSPHGSLRSTHQQLNPQKTKSKSTLESYQPDKNGQLPSLHDISHEKPVRIQKNNRALVYNTHNSTVFSPLTTGMLPICPRVLALER